MRVWNAYVCGVGPEAVCVCGTERLELRRGPYICICVCVPNLKCTLQFDIEKTNNAVLV